MPKYEGPYWTASEAEKKDRRWFGADNRYKEIATENSNINI